MQIPEKDLCESKSPEKQAQLVITMSGFEKDFTIRCVKFDPVGICWLFEENRHMREGMG